MVNPRDLAGNAEESLVTYLAGTVESQEGLTYIMTHGTHLMSVPFTHLNSVLYLPWSFDQCERQTNYDCEKTIASLLQAHAPFSTSQDPLGCHLSVKVSGN